MSTIKVDTIATRTGSGNITLSNSLASTTINRTGDGTTLTLQAGGTTFGTIGQDGSDLVIDGPSGHTGLRMTTSGLLPRQNGAIIDNTIDLGSTAYRYNDLYLGGGLYVGGTGAANHLDDYEKGTWTVGVSKNTAFTSPTSSHAYYIRVGDLAFLSFYWYKTGISSSGSNQWTITGIPFNMRAGSASGYQHGHVGYVFIGSDRTGNGNHRWQANAATELVLYGPNLNTNVSNQNVEFSGSVTCRLA